MQFLLWIQRVIASVVAVGGFIMLLGEADATAGIKGQLEVDFYGVVLIVVAVGWMLLTGFEEDWFVNKHKRN